MDIRSGQVRSGQVRSGQVRFPFLMGIITPPVTIRAVRKPGQMDRKGE
jgi:hypothetical protein